MSCNPTKWVFWILFNLSHIIIMWICNTFLFSKVKFPNINTWKTSLFCFRNIMNVNFYISISSSLCLFMYALLLMQNVQSIITNTLSNPSIFCKVICKKSTNFLGAIGTSSKIIIMDPSTQVGHFLAWSSGLPIVQT